jgi:hypothetical protein
MTPTPDHPTNDFRVTVPGPQWSVTFIDPTGQPTVSIAVDGKVTLSPGVTPDEAASAFWDAVERIGGERLERARREFQSA